MNMKQNIFDHASVFVLFSPVLANHVFFDGVSPIVHTIMTKNADDVFSKISKQLEHEANGKEIYNF